MKKRPLTSECPERQVLTYIGNDIDWPDGPDDITITFPSPFATRCLQCDTIHNYFLHEDVRPHKLTSPPPPGFENKF